jgi:hypothetical protein
MQRSLKRKGELSKERITRLAELGLDWGPFATAWEKNFLTLKQYKATHGDCNVPEDWPEDPILSRWVAAQRSRRTQGKLPKERVARLTALGLEWRRNKRR